MKITQLDWKYLPFGNSGEWRGSGTGIWSNIIFVITRIDNSFDSYMITVNIKHIQKTTCEGLDSAKQKAQAILNSYALSQAI